ncbi:zinc-dependent alcohol dehydrogenase family protein [Aliiruegeria sabulilitoris]|uniref:zinc-dependent alcohol dehydrogenase family protein n=1 Tax=Aliiruegeria sabulilitoris TaxID=1510458 RepID=UPI0008345780|nr:zinc-dependent alcohol dehydrogenase family protein [Aliiruegeria sabulilitoris]NDR57830.1 zinc-dependent alcohol dehydrogenase family protein [Pseudoruegeria sp. M32A2M]
MKAVVYDALGSVIFSEIETPRPAPGEVLIRVAASGVCHTDIDVLHGRYGTPDFPLVPGHEYAGVVEELGEGVSEFAVGDRVVVDPNLSCGHCRACRKGLANLCETLGAYGVSTNGGFAEYSAVKAENLVAIGDMPFNMAALAEPMGCVLNGVEAIGTEGVENALVVGAGPIGLLMAMALKTRGVEEIGLVDLAPHRLELAESFGFTPYAPGSAEIAALEHSVDLCVDATGVPAVAATLPGYTANGGKVLYFGVCPPDARIEISPFEVFRRQLTIAGAHSLNHNIADAIAALNATGPSVTRLVSHELPLEEIPKVLLKQGPEGTLKVQAR